MPEDLCWSAVNVKMLVAPVVKKEINRKYAKINKLLSGNSEFECEMNVIGWDSDLLSL